MASPVDVRASATEAGVHQHRLIEPRYVAAQLYDDLIVLDLKADTYILKENPSTDELAFLSSGSAAPEMVLVDIPLPTQGRVVPLSGRPVGTFRWFDVADAIGCLARARLLRLFGLRSLVANLRRACVRMDCPPDRVWPRQRLEDAVGWALLLYPFRISCVPRAAGTVLFYRRHGLQADFLIGAKGLPFQGHAWVQLGPEVLGESLPQVRGFRPLLKIPGKPML
jgi:hypothetical protein